MSTVPDNRYGLIFVCSGNTCRSPLAAAIARRLIEEWGWDGITVESAGTSADEGVPASEGATRAGLRHGLDLGTHRSRPVTPELMDRADLLLAMSQHHIPVLVALGGELKTSLLSDFAAGPEEAETGRGVPDPFGGDDQVYEETFRLLKELVEKALKELEPVLKT